MIDLDDQQAIAEADPGQMRKRIAELPQQCLDAWELAQEVDLPQDYGDASSIVVLGMGGSAIGGALLARLLAQECPVPILSVGGYELPQHVGPESLVVTSSYSGNTEETLTTFEQARERDCRVIAITTNGKLARMEGGTVLRFSYQSPPRAALGYSLTLLLALVSELGFVRDYGLDLRKAVETLEIQGAELEPGFPTARNPAKQLASELQDHLAVVYGAGFLAPVARRWKGQFNENSKTWAFWEEMPELNHNSVVGYGLPEGIRERAAVLVLRSSFDHPRIQARWEATQRLLMRSQVMVKTAWGRGENQLAQMLSLIQLGDYASFYLALLNGVDPTPVRPIEDLKKELTRIPLGQ